MFWEYINQIFRTPFTVIKGVFKNPMGIFVYGILSKWYVMITIASVVVTYWVFKGLEEAGVLQATEQIVSKALNETKAVAKFCTPKITDINAFIDCVLNPPEYTPTTEEHDLLESINSDLAEHKHAEGGSRNGIYQPQKNPYEQP